MPTSIDTEEYPYLVCLTEEGEIMEFRVDMELPEGKDSGLYEEGWGPEGTLDYCERCTDAARPGSNRDDCLNSQAGARVFRVTRNDFVVA